MLVYSKSWIAQDTLTRSIAEGSKPFQNGNQEALPARLTGVGSQLVLYFS